MRFRIGFGLVLLLPVLAAPTMAGQASPRGIYAVVSVVDEISALKTANPDATQQEMDAGFGQFYEGLIMDSAVAGLALQVHWDTVNPNPPGAKDSYFWNYVDDAFTQVRKWNSQHPGDSPKTIQLIMMPGFQSPQWLVASKIPSCNGMFSSPPTAVLSDCGTVTFTGFAEKYDSTTFPLPWNHVYKDAWKTFLEKVEDRYGSDPLFVSIAVAGPTAASAEMIVPNNANSDNPQYPDLAPVSPSDMWLALQQFHYQGQPAYQGTDQAFVDEWEDAIDTYGKIFHGKTLIVTTGNGFPNFIGASTKVPRALSADCAPNKDPDCAAEATILAYFMQPTVGGNNAKATQTSGMVASHEVNNVNDMGVPAVKQLSYLTKDLTWPAAQILGGSQFSATYSVSVLKEGCTDTFPPNPNGALPTGCVASTLAACLQGPTNNCIPVACIPQSCLAANVTPQDIAGFGTYGKLVAEAPQDLMPPEQGLFNVLNFYFDGTAAASEFSGVEGLKPAPMNYMQVYSDDIQYAQENASAPAAVMEGNATVNVTAQSLLDQASAQLFTIVEPPPTIASAQLEATTCRPGEKIQNCEWISIRGSNLAIAPAQAGKNVVPELAGTSVKINGHPADIIEVTPAQVRVQVPSGSLKGALVVVTTEFGHAVGMIK